MTIRQRYHARYERGVDERVEITTRSMWAKNSTRVIKVNGALIRVPRSGDGRLTNIVGLAIVPDIVMMKVCLAERGLEHPSPDLWEGVPNRENITRYMLLKPFYQPLQCLAPMIWGNIDLPNKSDKEDRSYIIQNEAEWLSTTAVWYSVAPAPDELMIKLSVQNHFSEWSPLPPTRAQRWFKQIMSILMRMK